ncbi:hypothetical protein NM208_g4831 [Fusarium decemcellulare]|uniref:Uncharacterized protein n=1 Tax=Fusarium decemcellulare TaxID=57161 RepID=A0ACC1SJ68_9HYPO|nr:hypothetical protein NM208_g4831 [Fusarium decemcellulare]
MASQSLLVRPSSQDTARTHSTEAVIGLETAVAGFQAQLEDAERTRLKSLQTTSPNAQSIIEFTEQLDDVNQKRRGRRIASGLSSFLQTIQQFSPAVDTFVSSNPETAGLIWGSIKLTFLILANFASYFKSFVNILDGFGSLCSLFSEYQRLFGTSVRLRDSICRFHTAVISCCQALVLSTRRSGRANLLIAHTASHIVLVFSKVSKAILRSFESEMRPYVDDIKAKAEEVQQDITLTKAKSDLEEHSLQATGRQAAASYHSRALSRFYRQDEWRKKKEIKRQLEQLLQDLSLYSGYNISLNSARSKRHHRTAEWVLDAQEFKDWHDKDGSTVLHITGKIGSGKSVLTSRIIEHINTTMELGEGISFFFCRFDDADSLDCDKILRSLVYQLLSALSVHDQESSTDKALVNAIQKAKNDYFYRDSLINLYKFATGLVARWFIILDGVDECPKDQRHLLFKSLSTLINRNGSAKKLKVLFSCRQTIDTEIQHQFSNPLQISTGSGRTRDDILTYAQDILEEKIEAGELNLGDPQLVLEILQAIESKEKGMKSDHGIRKALQDIPMDLDITFNRALERIAKEKHSVAARAIFQWTDAVRVPLTVFQLNEALSIEVGQKVWNPTSRYNDIEKLTLWCQNLVHIEKEDNTVRFSHHSIRDFLSSPGSGSLGTFHFTHAESDHHVGQICLTYLNITNVNTSIPLDNQPLSAQLSISGFSTSEIMTETVREVLPDDIRLTATRLINRMVARRDKSSSSNSPRLTLAEVNPGPLAVETREVNPTFDVYAERYWHSHTSFLTESSETYQLLRGMVKGTLLAERMPWMDQKWRSSKASDLPFCDWDSNSRYAISYANKIGNHNLLRHAFRTLAAHQHCDPGLLGDCLAALARQGHLACPEQCISRLQGLLKHEVLMRVIEDYIEGTLIRLRTTAFWPPPSHSSDSVCDCSPSIHEAFVNADICEIIASGYSQEQQPFLASMMCNPPKDFRHLVFPRIYKTLGVTEASLLRGRTVLGKTIFDLQAEGFRPDIWTETGSTRKNPYRIDFRGNLAKFSARSGVELGEIQRMATSALRWALRPRLNWGRAEELFRLIENLGRDAMTEDSYNSMEQAVNTAMYQALTEEQSRRLIEVYATSVAGWSFRSSSHLKIFSRAMFDGIWPFAKALSQQEALREMGEGNGRVRIVQSALNCEYCETRQSSAVDGGGRNFLAFCSSHWEQATKALDNGMDVMGVDAADDEHVSSSVVQTLLGVTWDK